MIIKQPFADFAGPPATTNPNPIVIALYLVLFTIATYIAIRTPTAATTS